MSGATVTITTDGNKAMQTAPIGYTGMPQGNPGNDKNYLGDEFIDKNQYNEAKEAYEEASGNQYDPSKITNDGKHI